MANENGEHDVKNSEDFSVNDVTLESILAEYKGSAFINGDKRTPTELLSEQTDQIIREAAEQEQAQAAQHTKGSAVYEEENYPGSVLPDESLTQGVMPEESYAQHDIAGTTQAPQDMPLQGGGYNAVPQDMPLQGDGYSATPAEERPLEYPPQEQPQEPQTRVTYFTSGTHKSAADEALIAEMQKDEAELFFDNYRYEEPEPAYAPPPEQGYVQEHQTGYAPAPELQDSIIQDVEKVIDRELGEGEVPEGFAQFDIDIGVPPQLKEEDVFGYEDSEDNEEPDLKDAMRRFAAEHSSITLRFFPALIITVIMVILTLAAEAGLSLPLGIGRSEKAAIGALIIMLLAVMMLLADIVVRGAMDLARGAPNAETLILFSCAFSLISGAFSMLTGAVGIMPYGAVSAASLTIAAFGEKLSLRAFSETLKTAVSSSAPYGVQAEYNIDIDKSVLKKAYNRTDGFYNNLIHPDVSETAYRYAAPILLAVALVLSVLTVVIKSTGEYFLHTLSALLAAAAPFSAMLTFSFPFGIVSKTIRKSGAAIAGWGGVDDICFTDGVGVTDDDLFPPGTLSFSWVKIYEGTPPDKAVRYTASLIMASGSGLTRMFAEALGNLKMEPIRVEEFACFEGGIGARIHGEYVMTGSAAFMNLLGLRVPDDMNMKNAVFTAINNKLVALFAIEYTPINSVQSALISMLKWRIKLFFAMRDFNITPLMLEQKFKVSLEDIEYIQAKDSYSISDSYSGRLGRMAALLAREGLNPFAEAITGGRLLKSASLIATVVSVVSAALGVIFMFLMCWGGSFMSAKPGNLLLFMLSSLAAVVVVCGYVRFKK